jgi:hypothetical protein
MVHNHVPSLPTFLVLRKGTHPKRCTAFSIIANGKLHQAESEWTQVGNMLATPIRWLLMVGVAASGYFTITSNDMNTRAFAFIGSVVCWQMYYITMMYEADLIASSKRGANAPPVKAIAQDGAPNGVEP